MAFTPKDASDSMIESLWEIALRISKEHAEALQADHTLAARLDADPELQSIHADRLVEKVMSTKLRHDYVFEQVPVGHDLGWMCYDANVYDGAPDGNTTHGLGKTKDEALADYLEQIDEIPKTTAPLLYSGSGEEPPDYGKEVTVGSAEDWIHDDE